MLFSAILILRRSLFRLAENPVSVSDCATKETLEHTICANSKFLFSSPFPSNFPLSTIQLLLETEQSFLRVCLRKQHQQAEIAKDSI